VKSKSDCINEFSKSLKLVSVERKNGKTKKYIFQPEIIDISVPTLKDTISSSGQKVRCLGVFYIISLS
jgi:hypothetical protein